MLEPYLLYDIIKSETIKQFNLQGHSLTGNWEQEVEIIEKKIVESYIIQVWGASYSGYVDQKLPASKVTDKMLPFIVRYVEQRMKLLGGHAWAVATNILKKWKKEGRPTRSSTAFSKTGKRTDFIQATIDVLSEKLRPLASEQMYKETEQFIINAIKEVNNQK